MQQKSLLSVSVALLLACLACVPQARTLEGEISGAPYRIHVPDAWNGTLVLYAHGYSNTRELGPAFSILGEALAPRGFAVAYSGYSDTGWAVAAAIGDLEALRERFHEEIGEPSRTYVMGHSMGGAITVALLELFPEHYAGGLALCGALDSSRQLWQENMLRLRVLYDAFFPGLPGDAVTFPEGFSYAAGFLPHFQESVRDSTRMAALLEAAQLPDASTFAGLMVFATDGIKDLVEHAGGNPLDYSPQEVPADLPAKLKRYAADEKARAYLEKYRTPSGDLRRPLLSLHNRTDYLVPLWTQLNYRERVGRAGRQENFVLQVVNRTGHCAINPQETLAGLLELVRWVEHGERPRERL